MLARRMFADRMPNSRGIVPLADVSDGERRDGGPEHVIRSEHRAIPVPVLLRWWDQICEPAEKLRRRERTQAVGPGRVDFHPHPAPTQTWVKV